MSLGFIHKMSEHGYNNNNEIKPTCEGITCFLVRKTSSTDEPHW